jgi:glycosyltransferase involved in cell wall biosynthesis
MKILIHSNAPWAGTGYGTQTAVLIEQFRHLGHSVKVSAFYGLQGAALHISSEVEVLAGSKDSYGNDMLLAHCQVHKPDVVVTLLDIWVLNPELLNMVKPFSIIPVDHDPIPEAVVEGCKQVGQPIAMSKFGLEQMKGAGIEKAVYIPHALNMSLYEVIDRADARKLTGLPQDKFVVGMVLANKGAPSRKAFDQQIRAFAAFKKKYPDSVLYMHTDSKGYQGENLLRICELAGLKQGDFYICDQYRYLNGNFSTANMVRLYNSFDVVLNATRGEGFGLPILESQACGTPVIVTDFSSMSELCYSGWKVGYVDKVFTALDSYQVIPDVKQIEAALEQAYLARDDGTYRDTARKGAEEYSHLLVADTMWKPLLETVPAKPAWEISNGGKPIGDRRRRRKAKAEKVVEKSLPPLEVVSDPA